MKALDGWQLKQAPGVGSVTIASEMEVVNQLIEALR